MLDYQKLYIAERERCEELEEELRQYRSGGHIESVQFVKKLPVEMKPRERVVLGVFLSLPPEALVTDSRLVSELLASERAYVTEYKNENNMVKAVVCTLRQTIAALGMTIDTAWGKGYTMNRASHLLWENATAPLR